MNQRIAATVFGLLLLPSFPTAASGSTPNLVPLESFIESELKRNQVPGCAVAIALEGEIVFAKGFGVVNLSMTNPVTADTLFRIGSTTKMFTAATLVSLVDEGKLKLDAPIGNYVKGLNPKMAALTAHQLLSHTAGLADETKMEGLHDESALAQTLRARGDDLCFTEPNKIWSYSNPGYWLAGLVIEETSGQHYADAVHEKVLLPLGMERSTFRPVEAMTWPVAIGHGPEGRGPPTVIRPLADNAAGWPAGQLFTTANEFAHFCIAFMAQGKWGERQALSPFVIEKLSTPYVAVPGGERRYGYGLAIAERKGLRWLSHNGSRTGYGSLVQMCPAKKFAVIILCNKTGASLPAVAGKAAELVLGSPLPGSNPSRKTLPMTAEELTRYAGVYSNGKTTVRLSVRDGKLIGPLGTQVNKIGEDRFLRSGSIFEPDAEFVFVPGVDGAIEYLCRSGRALKKISSKTR